MFLHFSKRQHGRSLFMGKCEKYMEFTQPVNTVLYKPRCEKICLRVSHIENINLNMHSFSMVGTVSLSFIKIKHLVSIEVSRRQRRLKLDCLEAQDDLNPFFMLTSSYIKLVH